MIFNIGDFIKTNKVIFIWLTFGLFIYFLRGMLGLLFITFIMCFLTHGLTRRFHRLTKFSRIFLVVIIYLVFLVAILSIVTFAFPKILHEAKSFTEQLPETIEKIDTWLDKVATNNELLSPFIEKMKETITVELVVSKSWNAGKQFLENVFKTFNWFFISLLFSFLIMLDFPNMTRKVRSLRFTKLSSFYEEISQSITMFGKVVGENFRAQILISMINTFLTAIGLYALGVGTIALLCCMVFICGLIPVLGVLLSSIPIVLVAINTGGVELALLALGMIVIIHAIEAYVLNPRIVSAVLHINPVMTLIILYISHGLIGLWGMLVGVPISVYIYRQLIMIPDKKLLTLEDNN